MPRPLLPLVAAFLVASIAPAAAGDWRKGDRLTGPVTQVIDGDTIAMRVNGADVHIRLHGIDAPEHDQTCKDLAGKDYGCGARATAHLAALIGAATRPCPSPRMHGLCLSASRPVVCEVTDVDRRYGRPVARCSTGGTDINRAMVSDGWAFAYTRYAHDYVAAAALARYQQRGIWSGTATDPADWRQQGQRP